MTRLVRFSNNAVSKLASAITAASTTISLQAGDGSKFPTLTGTQFFMATLVKSDGTTEVVKVTARTGDTLTVVRAAEAVGGVQTAYAFSSGDRIEHRLTAKAIGDELDRLDQAALIGAQNKTANYTVTQADVTSLIRMNTAGGNLTVTLPDITTLTDDFDVIVAKVSADNNVVTITRSGTDTINGGSSYSLTNQWQGAWLTADRSTGTWTVIASGGGGVKANVDTFTGTGTPGPFTLSGDPGIKENTAVYVGGVYQQKSTYTLTGTSLTVGGNVPAGVSVEVVWAAPLAVGVTTANQTTANDGASGSLFTTVQGFITRLMSSVGASMVGFIQAGAGAVQRDMQAKLREVSVSPQDSGAAGNGIANDTSAWSTWLSATGSKHIPAGSYLVSGVPYVCRTPTFVNTTDTNHSAGLFALDAVTTGNANTTFGYAAGGAITTGSQNTAVGKSALETMVAGNNNTALGFGALRYANDPNAIQNTCIGSISGGAITLGHNNTAVGHNSLFTLTTGTFNTALGQGALAYNVSGSQNTATGYHALLNYTGSNGVAYGVEALTALTTGINNTAVGYGALKSVTTQASNTALGYYAGTVATSAQGTYVGDSAGFATTTGSANTFVGYNAGVANQGGSNNVAIGAQSLISCVSGSRNVAVGRVTLLSATGDDNTAVGTTALNACTTGNNNTAVGSSALISATTGGSNTAIGYSALSSLTAFGNCSGVGYNAQVTASNQVQLGESSTTTYAYGAVQNRSDARDKADVRDTVLGLDFIKRLRPVDFRWDYREDYGWGEKDGSKKRTRFHHGLIAQEVKAACDEAGVEFGGYQDHSRGGGMDVLSIGYEELIAPLIKAVQEQAAQIDTLKSRILSLERKA